MKIFTCNAVTAVAVALFSIFSSINNEVIASSEIPDGMSEMTCGTLDGIYFYDQSNDQAAYGPIQNNEQIDLSELPSNFYLVAQTSGNIESVTWWVDGYTNTENIVLYTFPGGGENNNNWTGSVGTHNIDVNAYSLDDGAGNHCGQIWLTFEVTNDNNACNNVTSAGSIGSDGTVCNGSNYTINNIALPAGGSGVMEYVWLFNPNAPQVSGHTAINSNTASLIVSPTESGYYRRCARRAGCTDFLGESNWVYVEVNPCCTIDISASHTPNSSCDDPMTGSPTSCLCLGRMREVTFQYIGISNATINIYNNSNLDILIQSFYNVNHGDVVTTNASGFGDGRFLSKTFLELNGQITEIHTSCSQNIVGLTLDDYQILGYVDGEWNSCGFTQINNCNGSIDLNIIDGTAPYTIMWSNGSSSEDIDGLCSGDYSVSVTDANGCSFMETYSITNAQGDLNISSSLNHPTVCDGTIDPPSTNCLCNGRMRKVTFKYIGASNSTVNVFDNISQNTLIQTFYNVNYGDILTANAAGYSDGRFLSKTYFQSNGQFTEIHTSCSQNIVGLTLGSYEILGYVDSDWNECGSSITENCNGSIDLTVTSGSAPYSFIWSNGDTTEDLNGLCPGTYSVIVIDANGCQMNDSFEIHCNECMSNVSTDLEPEINVTCGDALPTPTFTNGTISSFEEYPAAQACTIELSSHASYDWRNFWFHSFPTVYDKNFVWEEGYVVVNPDNTAEIFGTVYNNTLTTSGYTVHYYFEQLVDYNTWIAGGGYNSTDADASSRLYAQVDFTKPNSIEGFGEFANSDLELVSTGDVAFMDLGPRDVYGGYGVGFWIDYAGTVNGYPAGNTLTMTASNHNDMYASVSNCTYAPTDACTERIIREWTVVDECGVEQIFLQNVIIDNNVAPTVTIELTDITLSCTDNIPSDEPTFSDNCGNGLTIDFNETTIAQACGLQINRIWTATSSCGLTASSTQVITVTDNVAPIGASVANVTLGCDDALPTDEPTFTDDCDNDLTITFDEVLNDLPCGHEYVRTWIATDDCGNQSSTITQTITIEDDISPIFTSVLPSDLSVDCFDDVPLPAEVIAQDNCGTVNLQYLETVPTDLCNSSFTRTWTATDECGNSNQHIQTISIMDNIAPVLSSFPADLTIECIEELPPVAAVTATDNCGTPTLVFTEDPSTDGCGEGVRRIWTATDACGNETEHMQSIFVIDTTAPTGTEIADVTISTDDALPTDAPVFNDNCDTDLDITFQETTNDLPCGYEVIRTWFATDFCGNVSTTIDQIITVTDDLSPINSSTSFETLVAVGCDEPIPSDAPVFTDNFDSDLEVTFNEVTNTLACQYEIVRTWFATDDCGNVSTTVSQTITVTDTNAPTGTLVTDVSIDCEVNLPTDEPAFTDNCDNNLVVTFDEILNDLPCGSEIIRTWFATDNCGNVSSTITQVITLTDNTAPVLDEAPADITVECLDDVPAVASVSALDNCGQASIDFLQTVANSSCNEIITRTWTATDECGNTSSVSQTITINDTTAPLLSSLPSDLTVECLEDVPPAEVVTATDNCTENVTVTLVEDPTDDFCGEGIRRTWTAIDACGNETSHLQSIFVNDTTAPEAINAPQDLIIECTDPVPTDEPTFTDNCSFDITVAMTTDTVDLACGFTITKTWTATDHCENETVITQVITIEDNTPPTIEAGEDMTIECGDPIPAPTHIASDSCGDVEVTLSVTTPSGCGNTKVITRSCTATDECGNTATDVQVITIVDTTAPELEVGLDASISCSDTIPSEDYTASDNCGNVNVVVTEETLPGTCPHQFVIERTYLATDDCGNETMATQTISVSDNEAPSGTGLADVTLDCADPLPTDVPTFTDNCDDDLEVTFEESLNDLPCGSEIIRTWFATDNCGNVSSTITQVITLTDNTAPVLDEAPADITVECLDDVPAVASVSALDNCGQASIDFLQTVANSSCNEIITRTWTATDECGNTSSVSQTITINDTTAPLLSSLPSDLTVECLEDVPPAEVVTATDNCTENVTVTLVEDPTDDFCGEGIRRTWTAIDACGNETSHLQSIFVNDTAAPEAINAPQDLIIECTDPVPTDEPTFTDNCSFDITVAMTADTVDLACGFTITKTWTATDHCENETVITQVITIEDNTPPTIEAGEDMTIECGDPIPAPTHIASDSCGDVEVTLSVTTPSGCGNTKVITRSCTATDECGNTATDVQVITIVDTTPPTLTVGEDMTIECGDPIPPPSHIASDTCGDVDVTLSITTPSQCGNTQTITRTCTATDECGNTTTGVQVITIVDTTNPVATNEPEDVTIGCQDTLPTDVPTFTDNCDNDLDVSLIENTVQDGATLITTKTWVATDDCGNAATVVQVITQTCEFDLALTKVLTSTGPFGPGDEVTYAINVINQGTLDASAISIVDYPPIGMENNDPDWTANTFDVGFLAAGDMTTVELTLTIDADFTGGDLVNYAEIKDASNTLGLDDIDSTPDMDNTNDAGGQPDSSSDNAVNGDGSGTPGDDNAAGDEDDHDPATLNACDAQGPIVECPADETLPCNASAPAADPSLVIASDPFGIANVVFVEDVETFDGCTKIITRTYRATDNCGNSSDCTQTFTIPTDAIAPVLSSLPGDLTVECLEDVPPAEVVTATDNCTDPVTVTLVEDPTDDFCGEGIRRTWTAIDACGNETSHLQSIFVNDTTAPEATNIPQDVTIECTDPVPTDEPTFTDNCAFEITVVMTADTVGLACGFTITKTWTAKDHCENETVITQVITITDTTPPTLVVGEDLTLECGDPIPAPSHIATDNCGDVDVTLSITTPSDCGNTQVITRTCTATDACGNSTTAVQVITIVDTTPPTLIVGEDLTLECGDPIPAPSHIATDECGDVDVSLSITTPTNCGDAKVITRTCTATDECGNTTTAVQVITIIDTTAPVFTSDLPADMTVECLTDVPAAAVLTAEDTCGDVDVDLSETTADGSCHSSITRTWTATDECGNEVSHQQVISINDSTAPVASNVPADATIGCQDDIPTDEPVFTDNCDNDLDVSFNENTVQVGATFTTTKTWIATDDCGNASTVVQVITQTCEFDLALTKVLTSAGPFGPGDIVTYAINVINQGTLDATSVTIFDYVPVGMQNNDADWNADGTFDVGYLAAGSNVTVNITLTIDPDFTGGDLVNYAEIKDASNALGLDDVDSTPDMDNTNDAGGQPDSTSDNAVNGDGSGTPGDDNAAGDEDDHDPATLNACDAQGPIVECPANETLPCNASVPAADPSLVIASDPAGIANVVFVEDVSNLIGCTLIVERTYRATDNCGNSSDCTQVFEIPTDNDSPVLSNYPENLTVQCLEDVPPAENITATDNCSENLTVEYVEDPTDDFCGEGIRRTWTAVDACGNVTAHLQSIFVNDTTAPTVTDIDDIEIECGDDLPENEPVFIDNCSPQLIISMNETTEDLACGSMIIRTWTAVDHCGNETSSDQVITINDTTPPVLIGVPQDLTIECDEIPGMVTVSANDICDGDIEVTMIESISDGCPYEITRTYSAADACGNTASEVQVITVVDTTSPVLLDIPADITEECIVVPVAPIVTANDNCSETLFTVLEETILSNTCPLQIERTWTATDACGNTSSASQLITIDDTIAPEVLNAPEDITVECTEVPDAAELQVSDNCDVDPVVVLEEQTIDSDCGYFLVRNYTVTDLCGNTTSVSYTVSVEDTTPPVLSSMPEDITVSCGNVPNASAVMASDACDGDLSVSFSQFGYNGTDCSGTLTRIWSAEDACGNDVIHTQIITIVDEEAPVLTAPIETVTISCQDDIPTDLPVYTDNCDDDVEITYTEVLNDLPCGEEIIRTFTAIDDCGNMATTDGTIIILDMAAPMLVNVPMDATVECDDIPDAAEVSATDDCSDVTVSMSEVISDGCPYTITRVWAATDECGNTTQAAQTLTVVDSTIPVFDNAPANETVECDAIPIAPQVTASDNCSDALVTFDEVITDGCPYEVIRTWTATDACGNVANYTQIITVEDSQLPVLVGVPADYITECGIAPTAATVTATDNCSGNLDVFFDETINSTSCPISITRTWTAMDACGNQAVATQNILISDEEAPVLSDLPQDETVQCDAIPTAAILTATDNCSNVIVNFSEVITDGCPYEVIRTWTATDDCGNTSSHTQTITVIDTIDPVLSGIPTDISEQCGVLPAPANPTAMDNCSGNLAVQFSEIIESVSCPTIVIRTWSAMDACGNQVEASQTITFNDDIDPVLVGVPANATVECDNIPAIPNVTATDNCDTDPLVEIDEIISGAGCSYEIDRIFTATDACGNSTQIVQTLMVTDTTDPVAVNVPTNVTIECGDNIPNDEPSFSDNCDEQLNIVFNDDVVPAPCGEIIVKQWTATDLCGNSTIVNQLITIEDTTSPELVDGPANVTIDCSDSLPEDEPTFSDICDQDLTIEMNETTQTNACGYTLTRTWTASDDCDNTEEYSQTIVVTDGNAPVITAPENMTVECDQIPIPGTPVASDLCDADLTITMIETETTGCPYTIMRTWTATDDCGNSSSATQVITVQDTQLPVLSSIPADIVVDCGSIPEAAVMTATDNCSTIDVVLTETANFEVCPFTISRTWTATDDCGNSVEGTQLITLNDNENPELVDFEGAINVQCDEADQIYITATDNCSDPEISIIFEQTFSGSCYGTIERVYLIEDPCGNSIMATQYLFLMDDEAPEFDSTPADDITILCGEPIPAPETLSASDNCDTDVVISVSDVESNGGNCPYVITRTYTALDACGNETDFVQTINVVGNPAADFGDVVITSAPNPFDSFNKVTMTVPVDGYVRFSAVNTLGQEIELMIEGELEAEILYEFDLRTENWDDGIYYLKLYYNDKFESHKIMKMN